jgi:two-component system, OmpR family, sensor histidine kinase TctE
MSRMRFKSLQVRLAVRLAALYVAATAVAAGVLIYQAYDTAASLNDRELSLRADDLARAVSRDSSGAAQLALSPKLASGYAASTDDIFAVRDSSGRVLAASPPEFGEQVSKWPLARDDPAYFHLTNLGSTDYYGLSVELASAAGRVSVSVARTAGANDLVSSLLREFVFDIAWVSPLLMAATLAIGILVVRGGLKPVREISRKAAAIGPNSTSIRLPDTDLPAEIKPLVDAVNHALDRLERGFVVQRQFTANAAHQLRTPLAIVTGALDAMQGNGELTKLRTDIARMNRLVEQLLRVARLDAIALELEAVDLNEIASAIVAAMAPWAIFQNRTVALVGTDAPVWVTANASAVEDAIRNLVENAVLHSPLEGEVAVCVHQGGRVSVADHGCGVQINDRERIFDRFWRGNGRKAEGAGLGLAIVREIMKAHGGDVKVADNPGGGAVFSLSFPLKPCDQARIINS